MWKFGMLLLATGSSINDITSFPDFFTHSPSLSPPFKNYASLLPQMLAPFKIIYGQNLTRGQMFAIYSKSYIEWKGGKIHFKVLLSEQ